MCYRLKLLNIVADDPGREPGARGDCKERCAGRGGGRGGGSGRRSGHRRGRRSGRRRGWVRAVGAIGWAECGRSERSKRAEAGRAAGGRSRRGRGGPEPNARGSRRDPARPWPASSTSRTRRRCGRTWRTCTWSTATSASRRRTRTVRPARHPARCRGAGGRLRPCPCLAGCQRFADYLDAVRKDFVAAARVLRDNCEVHGHSESCYKLGAYQALGKGGQGVLVFGAQGPPLPPWAACSDTWPPSRLTLKEQLPVPPLSWSPLKGWGRMENLKLLPSEKSAMC